MAGFWSSETMHVRVLTEGLIAPFDPDRVVNGAYELCLGSEIYVTSTESDTKRTVEPGEQITIPPGQFANLLTEEVVTVPSDALGFISVKFRLKQRGLVNVSGFHVDPGYSWPLVFSVYNAGPRPIVLTRGEPAFLLWYASLDQETTDLYKGERPGGITAEEVMHLQGEIATPQALATRVQSFEDAVEARLAAVEGRLNGWAKTLSSTWSTIWKAAIGIAVAALIGLLAGVFDNVGSSNEPTTTTSTSSSVTTATSPASTTSTPSSTLGP